MSKFPIILDDFVDKKIQNEIEDLVFDCDWKYSIDNTYDYFTKVMKVKYRKFLNPSEHKIYPSLSTNIFCNKELSKLVYIVLEKTVSHINFNLTAVDRCIGGIMGFQSSEKNDKICNIHINQKTPHLVLLYYVNDADGETIIYDKTIDDVEVNDIEMNYPEKKYQFKIKHKIMPKKGRVLLFDGKSYHSGSSPTTGSRCIITLDLFGEFLDGSYKYPYLKKEKNNMKYN